jgi:predicted SAM-dependent methyltransferase
MADLLKLFVGTGVEGIRPVGYKTIDISSEHNPDIVADASDLSMVLSESVDEFHASHVLEHFSWPRALLVLKEWTRVLKIGGTLRIAVPDMEIYAHFLLNGHDAHSTMMDIYGAHWAGEGGPQGHHFGYTRRMLSQILAVMGFADLSVWRSDFPEAANTWTYGENQEKIGVSLNISGVKRSSAPLVDIPSLAHHIRYRDIKEPFMVAVRRILADEAKLTGIDDLDAVVFQKMNFRFLEQSHLASVLQAENKALKEKIAELAKSGETRS